MLTTCSGHADDGAHAHACHSRGTDGNTSEISARFYTCELSSNTHAPKSHKCQDARSKSSRTHETDQGDEWFFFTAATCVPTRSDPLGVSVRVTAGGHARPNDRTTKHKHNKHLVTPLSRLTQTYTMSTAVRSQTVAPLGACGRADRLVLLPVRALARHAAVRDSLAAAADHVFLHGVLG